MFMQATFTIAIFTAPEHISTAPQSMLWLIPLAVAIAIVYKATKLPEIKFANFLKESVLLFGSIVIFMLVTALVLYFIAWLIIE